MTDGLDGSLASRHAILEHWIQQVAEVRYNILADAPVPTRWLPDPAEIDAASRAGRTWLIVHRTDCPNFDEAYLAAEKRQLQRWLGPPEVYQIRLTRGESLTAYHFGPPNPDNQADVDFHLMPAPLPSSQVAGNWAVSYDETSQRD